MEFVKQQFKKEDFVGLNRVVLLKKVESVTGAVYKREVMQNEPNADLRAKMQRVVFESNLAGIAEFSEEWFTLIKAKMARMQLCRDFCLHAVSMFGEESGFDAFERTLIVGCSKISGCYDQYYLAYLEAVQNPTVLSKIEADAPSTSQKDCYSHYTIVEHKDGYTAVPFGTYFKENLRPIVTAMDDMIAQMLQLRPLNDSQKTYLDFFTHYRVCLSSESNADVLNELWTELDRKWMDTKGDIQIVHDIETGYGDPLRVKATPDFSIRFLDNTYEVENNSIRKIQNLMMEYFAGRDTPLARNGLAALGNTMAGIYSIPFKTGVSLQFSFSGQSIPNRQDVALEKGVKIYFDAVETEARIQQNNKLVEKVFSAPAAVLAKYKPDAIEQLVWHVAAHEVGHAIYNLGNLEEVLGNPAVVTLLEEPRAELTAMFTLNLLYKKEVLDLVHLKESLAHFALDALRYFAKFKSEPLRPYIIFQIFAYKTYFAAGYLQLNEAGEVVIDDSKTLEVLQTFSDKFECILDAEDASNATALQQILDDMAVESDFVKHVVGKVF